MAFLRRRKNPSPLSLIPAIIEKLLGSCVAHTSLETFDANKGYFAA